MSARIVHSDGLVRCPWPKQDPLYIAYHDEEWGVPEYDDRALYEKLVLDGFQAGLAWITILRKRDNFRKAFDDFQPEKIARYTPKRVERLMQDAGIVRNRAKIEGAVGSAITDLPDSFCPVITQRTSIRTPAPASNSPASNSPASNSRVGYTRQ